MSIRMEVWGEYALFTRPEMKAERVSYDVITPSAARGLLESVFWHPGLKWNICSIRVCAPIEFVNIRRNEVKSVCNLKTARSVMERGTGRALACRQRGYSAAGGDASKKCSLCD